MPRVSLCMIVKNEEANLPACLDGVAGLCDEIIVVDTGSTDRTREVALARGARVYDFPWIDDFSAARNEALRHATGEWIFWLDADDRVGPEDRRKLESLLGSLPQENVVYLMRCVSVMADGVTPLNVVDHPRLFRRRPGVGWVYRVHEQVLPSVLRHGAQMQRSDVTIHHAGYQDAATRRRKDERNLVLLERDARNHPNDHSVFFHMGLTLLALGKPAEALPHLEHALARAPAQDPTVRKLYGLVAQARRRTGQIDAAIAACRQGLERFPDDPEVLFQEGVLLFQNGDLAGAERSLTRLLAAGPGDYVAVAVDPDIHGARARFNLGVVYRDQGRFAEAEAQWQQIVRERPSFADAWMALADHYLATGRREEALAAAAHLRGDPARQVEAAVVEGRVHLADRNFAAARNVLDAAIASAPQSVALRVVKSHVLLQEGRDPASAERALEDVLALEPGNSQARSNLEKLRQARAATVSSTARPRVSLTMIVKNEEANLPRCLSSIRGLFDEIVVVDTGSTDRSREVAAAAGARVVDFAWRDDFSAARNEALRHATGEWAFWLDADEWLDESNRRKLEDLVRSLKGEKVAYVLKQLSVGQAALPGTSVAGDQVVEQVRLFPRLPGVVWEHRVYEQVLPSVRRLGGELRHADVIIHHAGYSSPQGHQARIERNLRLAQIELAERPDDPYVLYLLGVFLQMLGKLAESIGYLQQAAERCAPGASYAPKVHALLVQGLHCAGRREEALTTCRSARSLFPSDAELPWLESILNEEAGDLAGAQRCLEEVLAASAGQRLRTSARHRLALLCRRQNRAVEAERHWKAALTEQPDFAVAWLELAELYLAQGRWADVEMIAAQVAGPLGRPEDAAVLRSRWHLFRKEFSQARAVLEEAIARAPKALRPRLALSHVLLHEGRDLAAAEKALRDVLALDPNNVQARSNLEMLLRRQAEKKGP